MCGAPPAATLEASNLDRDPRSATMSNIGPFSVITAQALAAHRAVLAVERARRTAYEDEPEPEPAPARRSALVQLVQRLRRHHPAPVA
jgi:hypothetical protein